MIRGIDNQIMINKSLDYGRQMSDQNNNIQQGKDFITQMEKARLLHEEETVIQVKDEDTPLVRKDKDPKEQAGEHGYSAKAHEEEEEETFAKGSDGIGVSLDINV